MSAASLALVSKSSTIASLTSSASPTAKRVSDTLSFALSTVDVASLVSTFSFAASAALLSVLIADTKLSASSFTWLAASLAKICASSTAPKFSGVGCKSASLAASSTLTLALLAFSIALVVFSCNTCTFSCISAIVLSLDASLSVAISIACEAALFALLIASIPVPISTTLPSCSAIVLRVLILS